MLRKCRQKAQGSRAKQGQIPDRKYSLLAARRGEGTGGEEGKRGEGVLEAKYAMSSVY